MKRYLLTTTSHLAITVSSNCPYRLVSNKEGRYAFVMLTKRVDDEKPILQAAE